MRRCCFLAGAIGGRASSSLQRCAFGEVSGGGAGGGEDAPWAVHARTAQRLRAAERAETKREVSQPSTTTTTLPFPPAADSSFRSSSSARAQGGDRRPPSPFSSPTESPPRGAASVSASGVPAARLRPSPSASPLAAFARRNSGGAAAPTAPVSAAPRGNTANPPSHTRPEHAKQRRYRDNGGSSRGGQSSDTLRRSRVRPGAQALLRPEETRAGLGGMVCMPDETVARYLRQNFRSEKKESDSAAKAQQLNLIRRELRSLVAAGCVVGPRTKSVLMSLYSQLDAHGMAADVFVSALEAVQGSTARVHSNALAAGLLAFARAKRFDAVPPLLEDSRLRPLVADGGGGGGEDAAALSLHVSLANALLTCFVKAPPGHAVLTRARARGIFQRMVDGGLANAQTRALHLRGGGTLEGAAGGGGGGAMSRPLFSAMLKAAAREGAGGGVAAAEKVWAAHAPQMRMAGEEATPAYNTMLQVAREEADPDAVLRWMQRMADATVPSDAFTFAIAIGAWVEASQHRGDRYHRLASETFSLACSSGCGGNVKVCGGMAQLYAATKDVVAMKKLEEHMHLCNVLVTSVIRDYITQCQK